MTTVMPAKQKRAKVPPLKLDVAEMRRTLALLKQGKLIAPDKKPKKPRTGQAYPLHIILTR